MKSLFQIAALAFVFLFILPQKGSANLVQDPNFTSVSYSGTLPLTTLYGQFGTGAGSTLTVANWATTGYNFVYAPSTADVGTQASGANSGKPNEAPGQYNAGTGYGNTYLWGPNNGSSNGLPSTDPAGGNFIAADGAYEIGAISQTMTGTTGLQVGQVYILQFWWAGAQQQGFTGTNTETWTASLGGQSFTTGTVNNVNEGFTGWTQQTFYYTATNATETLSFLASGTPSGEPPFSLLGGVYLGIIPEFSNWMVFAGFGAACILFEVVRRRIQSKRATIVNLEVTDPLPDPCGLGRAV